MFDFILWARLAILGGRRLQMQVFIFAAPLTQDARSLEKLLKFSARLPGIRPVGKQHPRNRLES